ncbi:MAG: peptidyl-prolyl cis-trans isomerase [Alphaproteobacteria bacterium]|nr:peptidyl-prolyl cis-trans isomerase [Alphaproteobacteria bacterium]
MKTSLLKSISFVAFLAAATPLHAADPVVANVNGQKFTYSQVMEAKANLPKQYQSAPDDKIFPVLLNQIVDTNLIEKAASTEGLENKPEVKKAIEKAKEGIIAQAYLLEKVKDKITDAAIQEKYNEVIKNFPKEKEVHLRHILVKDQAIAQSIIKALKNGTDFKKLAKEKSTDGTKNEGGDLGFFRKSELPKELAEEAFTLKPGAYSQTPIKTDFGWHVIMVEQLRDAVPPKFDEIKTELKGLMTQEAVVALVKGLRATAKIELFDKDGKPMPLEPEKEATATPASKELPAPASPQEKK